MAAVGVVMPALVPVPVARIGRLALAAADALVCLWITSLWAIHASLAVLAAAVIRGLVICGLECTGAAWKVALVSLPLVAILWPLLVAILWLLAAILLIKFLELYTNQLDEGAAIRGAIVEAHLNATAAFAFLELFGFLLSLFAANLTMAFVIMVVPPLGISVMCCLVSIPGLALRVWRMRRCTSFASVVPI